MLVQVSDHAIVVVTFLVALLTFVLGTSVGLGVAITVSAHPDRAKAAKACFSVGALGSLVVAVVFWLVSPGREVGLRISVVSFWFLATLVGLSAAFRFADRGLVKKGRDSLQANNPNLVCLGTADIDIELDRHEVFHLSNNQLSLRALAIKIVNQSRPPKKVGRAERLGAHVVCNTDHFQLFELDYICWLDHEQPFITAERDLPYYMILGVVEPKPLGGFEKRVTFYRNYLDERTPLERVTCQFPIKCRFTVNLRAGEHGEFGSDYEFEFAMESDQTYTFEQVS